MFKLFLKDRHSHFLGGLFIVCACIWLTISYRSTNGHKLAENVKTIDMENHKKLQVGFQDDILQNILRDCGQLCNTSRKGTPGKFFDEMNAPIDCEALFLNEYIDRGHGLPKAPKEIPKSLLNAYTMDNRIRLRKWYFNEQFLGHSKSKPVWTVDAVDKLISLAKKGVLGGTYGINQTNSLRDGLKNSPGIKDGRILVIGSRNPWVEACVLEAGAKSVVTLEYGEIVSKHPKLKTMIPSEFRKSYLDSRLGQFDGIVTFSSVEHSGLGRFGDMLNPWGDIITIARAWCVTKPGGFLTIGVPYDFENEYIRFNGDRGYGKIRYPYLTTNWKQFYRGWGIQCVHVFIKKKLVNKTQK